MVNLVRIDVYMVKITIFKIIALAALAAKPYIFQTCSYDKFWSPSQNLSNELLFA